MNPKPVLDRRRAGVLLHPTSLPGGERRPWRGRAPVRGFPGAGGIHRLADAAARPHPSRRLALSCPVAARRQSPADQPGAVGGMGLADRRLILPAARPPRPTAWSALRRRTGFSRAPRARIVRLETFIATEAHWLPRLRALRALRRSSIPAKLWYQWPAPLRDREPRALAAARARLAGEIARVGFEQFAFARQWQALRAYAGAHGVLLFGDMPIFVAHDSVDVGPIATTLCSMTPASRSPWPACHRITFPRPASAGAIRSMTGSGCGRTISAGGSRA